MISAQSNPGKSCEGSRYWDILLSTCGLADNFWLSFICPCSWVLLIRCSLLSRPLTLVSLKTRLLDKYRCWRLPQPFTVELKEVASGSAFHQCVYLLAQQRPDLVGAGDAARAAFGEAPADFMPHLSLLYSDIPRHTRCCSLQHRLLSICIASSNEVVHAAHKMYAFVLSFCP